MKTTFRILLLTAFAAFSLVTGTSRSVASSLQTSGTSASASNKKATAKAPPPSSQDIADAKAKGLVWVNTSTRVYHKDSSSLYGKTKRGKFMTEDDAKKAGFRAANESGAPKKTASAAATQK
jgi:hypothetical protein